MREKEKGKRGDWRVSEQKVKKNGDKLFYYNRPVRMNIFFFRFHNWKNISEFRVN